MYINVASISDVDWFQKTLSWPISEAEKEALFQSIIEGCRDLLVNETDHFREQILRAFLPLLAVKCLNVCYAGMLVERLKRNNMSISNYRPSPLDSFSWLLKDIPLEHRIVRTMLPSYRNMKNWLKFGVKRLNRPDYDAMLVSANPTAEKFFRINDINVYESRVYEWFSPLAIGLRSNTKYANFTEHIFETLWASVESSVRLDVVRRWMFEFIDFSVCFIAKKLVELYKSKPARRTKKLFTATQGKLGMRLISLAVMENGGEVITFPHSGGMLWNIPNAWMIEPLTTKLFYCYTQMEKEIRTSHVALLGSKNHASFEVLPQGKKLESRVRSVDVIRNVIFLSGGYLGDMVYGHVLPEILRFDFEMKIIDELLNNDLNITVKSHRKTRVLDKQKDLFRQRFGDRIRFEDTPLTKMLNNDFPIDAFVLENVSGGALIEVIKTKKPVILFSPHVRILSEEAKDSFYKRVKVIPCWMDDRNRVNFDKDEVKKYFTCKKRTIDFEVVNKFTNTLFEY